MSRNKYWSLRLVPWLVGLLLVVLVTAVLAAVTSVNIDSPTLAAPVYITTLPGNFNPQYDIDGTSETVTVNVYIGISGPPWDLRDSKQLLIPVIDHAHGNVPVPLGTANGKYDLKVEAVGSASTQFDVELEAVIVDDVDPTITNDPIATWVNSLANVTGTSSDATSGVAKVELTIKKHGTPDTWWDDGVPGWVGALVWNDVGNTTWTYADPGWADGETYTVCARATDEAGNVSDACCNTFTYDSTLPSVAITDPPTGDQNASVSPLAGTASDTGSGIASVEVQVYNVTGNRYWNGATNQWVATPEWNNHTGGTLANWTYTMPPLTSGREYEVTAKATDVAGNSDTDGPHNFDYDDVDPTVTITMPDPATDYYNTMVEFAGTANDDASGVDKVEVKLQNLNDLTWWDDSVPAGWVVTETLLIANVTGLPDWTYDSSAVTFEDDVTYEVWAKATDNADNDPGVSDEFTIDETAPAATIDGIDAEVGCAFDEISGTSSDATSGVEKVWVKIEQGGPLYWDDSVPGWVAGPTWNEAADTDPWTYDVSDVTFANGVSYTVSAKATDNVGLETDVGDQDTDTFTYDECPTVAITAPADASIHNTLAEFSGTSDDAGTGSVQDVQVKIENGAFQDWISATDTSDGDWSTWKYTYAFAVDGVYTLSAKAQDDFGQWSVEDEISFTFDATAPSATIYSIPDPSEPQEINGTASDSPSSGLASVKVKIQRDDDGHWWDPTKDDGWSPTDEVWTAPSGGTLADWTFTTADLTDALGADFAFEDGEVYTVTVKAEDNAGNETAPGDQRERTFTYGTDGPFYNINLGQGWNLMSLPLIPGSAIEDVLAELIDLGLVDWVTTFVWEGDPLELAEKRWVNEPRFEQLTDMDAGQGYWMVMHGDGILVNDGRYLPAPPGLPSSYDVYTGWNLIGYHATTEGSLTTPATVENYLGAVYDSVEAMYYFEGGLYKAVTTAGYQMQLGYGYWMALIADGTIYP